MKKYFFTLLFAIVSFIGYSQTKNFIDQPYIEVSGTADTLITPNRIIIRIVVSEKDTRDKVSLEESEMRMINALKAIGINTEEDLTISDILSNYKFYLLKQKDILKTKEYFLKVSNAATASKVFVQLEDIGLSNASIEKADYIELESIKNICRAKAIENAKLTAMALTKPLSQTVGDAIFISDAEGNFDNLLQGRVSGVQIKGYALANNNNYEPPKIEFKKIPVSATVNVRFILK